MTVFDNAKALWQWEFAEQAERSYAAAAATARDVAGAQVLLAKAMDGTDWIDLFDPGNVGSVAAWRQAAADVAAAGLTLVPWVVPHGQNPATEAVAHAQLGPVLMVDLEPYTGFWTGPVSGIPTYLQALRAAGVEELHVSIDPRASAVSAIGGGRVLDSADGIHPQVYWTDFAAPALRVVPLIQAIVEHGGPAVYPALPGDGAAADLAAVWSAAQGLGCPGVSVWRLGSMNAAQLAAFANLPVPQEEAMTPDQVAAAIAAAVAPIQAQLDRLNAVLAARFGIVQTSLAAAAAALDPANPPAGEGL